MAFLKMRKLEFGLQTGVDVMQNEVSAALNARLNPEIP